ncbi:MAG: fibronectin type III domain-containing protein [Faecalibacterium sp.]|nr:fibronectin type III domain-containing protein [Faecalibacterium sp.]
MRNNFKRIAAAVLASVSLLALVACGGSSSSTAAPAVTLTSPARPKATSPSATTCVVNWKAVEGATKYYVVYDDAELTAEQVAEAVKAPDAAADVTVVTVEGAETLQIEDRTASTLYYFAVVAASDNGISKPSQIITTTTRAS